MLRVYNELKDRVETLKRQASVYKPGIVLCGITECLMPFVDVPIAEDPVFPGLIWSAIQTRKEYLDVSNDLKYVYYLTSRDHLNVVRLFKARQDKTAEPQLEKFKKKAFCSQIAKFFNSSYGASPSLVKKIYNAMAAQLTSRSDKDQCGPSPAKKVKAGRTEVGTSVADSEVKSATAGEDAEDSMDIEAEHVVRKKGSARRVIIAEEDENEVGGDDAGEGEAEPMSADEARVSDGDGSQAESDGAGSASEAEVDGDDSGQEEDDDGGHEEGDAAASDSQAGEDAEDGERGNDDSDSSEDSLVFMETAPQAGDTAAVSTPMSDVPAVSEGLGDEDDVQTVLVLDDTDDESTSSALESQSSVQITSVSLPLV